jgi:diguanylate cyclase (GGDEF)-like protein
VLRGSKATWLKDVLLILPPAVLFAILLSDYYARFTLNWFLAAGGLLLVHTVIALFNRYVPSRRVALFQAGLLIAGVTALPGMGWAHMAYIPLVLAVAIYFDTATLGLVMASAVLLDSRHLFLGDLRMEAFLFSVVALTALLGVIARNWKMRHDAFFKTRHDSFNFNLMRNGEGFDHEQDAELRYILKTVMFTIMPGSVTLFLLSEGELALRCSTEEDVEILPEGLIHDAFTKRTSIVTNSLSRGGHDPGYRGKRRVSSLVASTVMDGTIPLGVLVVDDRRTGAFSDADVKAVELFSSQIAGMLSRRRVMLEMERSQRELRVLQEQSARLMATMELDDIYQIAVEGARGISEMGVALFLANGKSFKLAGVMGIPVPGRKNFTLKDTLAGMAAKNGELMYVPNTRGYSLPAIPFNKGDIASALMLPIVYDMELLGLMALVSSNLDPLSPRDMELLLVLMNQSAISIKNAMLHAEIKKKSITDGLTGLFNHKHFQERFDHELRRTLRNKKPLSLLLMDIDFFKKINDIYGHQAGDEVLRHVSGMLKGALRDIDVPARYGGEEFAAVLVETDKDSAVMTAERLREELEASLIKAEGHDISITASFGVATYPVDARTKDEIIGRADKALYYAKENGRNMVVTGDTGGQRPTGRGI